MVHAPRIDSHMHVWQLSRGDYGWLTPELVPLYRDFGIDDVRASWDAAGIDGAILVQAAPTVAETRYLLAVANSESGFKGVVGWIDMLSPDAVDELVDALDLIVKVATVVIVKIASAGALHPQVIVVHPLPHLGGDHFADDAGVLAGPRQGRRDAEGVVAIPGHELLDILGRRLLREIMHAGDDQERQPLLLDGDRVDRRDLHLLRQHVGEARAVDDVHAAGATGHDVQRPAAEVRCGRSRRRSRGGAWHGLCRSGLPRRSARRGNEKQHPKRSQCT